MTGFETNVLQNDLCNGCDCTGFVPVLTYAVTGTTTKTLTVTDASTFGAGDGLLSVNVWVYDKQGGVKEGHIAVAAGNAAINLTDLDVSVLDVKATVVSTAGCKTDLGIYNIPSTGTGELLNKSYQGNRKPIK